MVIGFDEVGRGALAGPVYTGSVLLTKEYPELTHSFCNDEKDYQNFEGFEIAKDSKQLKPELRDKIVEIVKKNKIENSVLSAGNNLIDEFGIGVCLSHLLLISIQVLAQTCHSRPDQESTQNIKVIADGKIKLLDKLDSKLTKKILEENNLEIEIDLKFYGKIKQKSDSLFETTILPKIEIIRENKADDKYLSVALASNLAKVERDNLMKKLHQEFPEYNWERNVGYATKQHREAIKKNPNNGYFRHTWLTKIVNSNKN